MKAILEFDAPETCSECMLFARVPKPGSAGINDGLWCFYTKERIENPYDPRPQFCPLKIDVIDALSG